MQENLKESLKGISVIIPTRNRSFYVKKLLRSLHFELKSSDVPSEVIVVDSSEPEESKAIFDICSEYGCKFYFLKGSISQARNLGINIAKFPIVLFVDSDCEVLPGLLKEHVKAYTEENIGGVLGLTNFIGKRNRIWKIIERTPFHVPFSFARRMEYAPWGTCTNISFRKELLFKVGGFKTKFPFDFSGEDVDIGLRINQLGYKIKCNPQALVNHHRETWSNLASFCKKIFRWGRTAFHILKQHPYLSTIDFPKFSTVLLLLFFVFLLFGFLGITWKMCIPLIIWLSCAPLIEAILNTFIFDKKMSNFWVNYCSLWLIFIYEFGGIFESLKNRSLSLLYRRHIYGHGQILFEWKQNVLRSLSFIVCIALILVVLVSM